MRAGRLQAARERAPGARGTGYDFGALVDALAKEMNRWEK